ncbi:MAG: hypothetical protein E6G75_09850 [Alphaproteobacteria bacterium]|nr:MAG: hypothetical protein E6G75_09850 [Alphaproteobacteria bacterium]
MNQNGHGNGWVTKVRRSLGVPSTAIGIDLLNGTRAGIFLAAYVILEWISFIHEYKGLPITPWNPGLGVVFALMVFAGSRYGIVLFAGVVLAEILVLKSKLEWPIILSIAAIIAAGYGVVALVLRKHFRIDIGLNHLSDVFILLFAGISGAILVALMLSILLLTDAEIDFGDVIVTFAPLLIGDAIGIAVMTPLTLRLILNPRRSPIRFSRTLVLEILFYVLLVTVTLWIIIGTQSANGFKFFYLLFVPVVVAAVRHGLDGACVSLGLSQIALVGIAHIHSYDAQAFTEFQTLMLILTATGLIVGVVVSERVNSDRRVREAETRLKQRESEAAQASSFNLVSGMASALIHEINQPMTAARALARSAQHLLRAPGGDLGRADSNLTTMIAQIDHASGVVRRMRDFLRRGRPRRTKCALNLMLPKICLPFTAIARNWNRWCSILFEMQSSRSQEHVKLTDASESPHIDSTRPRTSRSAYRTTVPGSTANWRTGYSSLSQHRKRLVSALACQFACRLSNRMAGASGSIPGRRAQPSSDFRCRSLNRK